MALACELCGQPAARTDPTLCAECYYRYWEKTRFFGSSNGLPEYSVIAER